MSEGMIERWVFGLTIPRAHGVTSADGVIEFREEGIIEGVVFRATSIVTDGVTDQGQLWLEQIMFMANGHEFPQLVGGDGIDAYVFSTALMERQQQAYMKRYGLKTRAEFHKFVERVAKAWDRYELGRGKRPKEELPPRRPRLFFQTLEAGSTVVLCGRWGSDVPPDTRASVVLTGDAVRQKAGS